jgi:hypothetical protein
MRWRHAQLRVGTVVCERDETNEAEADRRLGASASASNMYSN